MTAELSCTNEAERHGVNAVLLLGESALLLSQERDEAVQWEFPGGTFDIGIDKSLAACCDREVMEETGIQLGTTAYSRFYTEQISIAPRRNYHSRLFTEHYYYCALNMGTMDILKIAVPYHWVNLTSIEHWVGRPVDRRAVRRLLELRGIPT